MSHAQVVRRRASEFVYACKSAMSGSKTPRQRRRLDSLGNSRDGVLLTDSDSVPPRVQVPHARRRNARFAAAFFGWMLDGFDFTILTFVLADIQRSFTVDNALAGALGR